MPKKKTKAEERNEEAELAALFKALGDPTRLRLFQFLRASCGSVAVEDGEDAWMQVGPTVSEACCAATGSKKITALVSHHLKEMRMAGLITVKRRGKNMICGVRRDTLVRLADFLGSQETPLDDEPFVTEVIGDILADADSFTLLNTVSYDTSPIRMSALQEGERGQI